MPNFPRDPYNIIDMTGVIPTLVARFVSVALLDGPGIYEYGTLAVARTNGVASASVAPVLSTVDPPNIEVFARHAALAYAVFPLDTALFQGNVSGRFFRAPTTNIFIALEPSVFGGDQFSFRLMVKRLL